MASQHPRMIRERKTVEAMIRLYCDRHHHAGPRVLLRHPVLAVLHLFDRIVAKPVRLRSQWNTLSRPD